MDDDDDLMSMSGIRCRMEHSVRISKLDCVRPQRIVLRDGHHI